MRALMVLRVALAEIGSAAAVVAGANELWGRGAALIAVGVCLYLKAFEWDSLRSGGGDGQ